MVKTDIIHMIEDNSAQRKDAFKKNSFDFHSFEISEDECNPNEEARQMAISMVPKITHRVIREAKKNPSASARFYELPPPNIVDVME